MSQVSWRLRRARDRGPVLSTKARETGESMVEFQTEEQSQDLIVRRLPILALLNSGVALGFVWTNKM